MLNVMQCPGSPSAGALAGDMKSFVRFFAQVVFKPCPLDPVCTKYRTKINAQHPKLEKLYGFSDKTP
ncbi:hypothetical protein [Paenibacillus apis]|uniref:hypothetical protein n=1 Tax=Paenibacillus apis TaxID=1792174 RepID=UPI0026580FB4|nr:hypothetical protein [Paenibacillus apis]